VFPTESSKGGIGYACHRSKHNWDFNPVLAVLKSQLAQQPFRNVRLDFV
jgi:hypothetical protein